MSLVSLAQQLQVKTTQPRRYLVRPNQGIISPQSENNQTVQIQILLVEKDKNTLYQSFLRLGQAALDHCKDKFLVQSTAVRPADALRAGDYDALTDFWVKMASNPGDKSLPAITNKKLTVVHTGVADERAEMENRDGNAKGGGGGAAATPESELEQLKKKYDELVQFSVNLTAERDVLNNTLEQTKRDLNRYMSKAAANDNSGGGGIMSGDRAFAGSSGGGSGGISMVSLLMVAFVFWLAGCYSQAQGKVSFLQSMPVIGSHFQTTPVIGGGGATAASSSPTKTVPADEL